MILIAKHSILINMTGTLCNCFAADECC